MYPLGTYFLLQQLCIVRLANMIVKINDKQFQELNFEVASD